MLSEQLVSRVVIELSINKDHARERLKELMDKGKITHEYWPDRKKMTEIENYLQKGK